MNRKKASVIIFGIACFLLSDIESLLIYGGVHEKHHGFHRAPAKRFPFFIDYFVEKNIAYVVAVLPMKERPSLIETELTDRSV